MLHNRLSQLFQRESDRLLKSFLNDNQDLLKKYVNGGVVVVGAVLTPINAFMRHLLVVQGLDPDTTPGEKQRALVQEALASFFEKVHDKALDEDYDLSWVRQRFEDTRKNFSKFNLTQAKFMELTDLSKIPSSISRVEDVSKEKLDDLVQRVNPVADPAPKRETSIALDDAIQQLRDFMTKIEKSQPEEKVEEKQHTGIKTGKKSVNKTVGYGKSGKSSGRGSGTRVRKISSDHPVQIKEPTIKQELAEKRSQDFTERAVKLVNDMIDRGLVEGTATAVQEQTKQIMSWNEESLAAMERVVAKHFKLPSDNKFKGSFRRVQK